MLLGAELRRQEGLDHVAGHLRPDDPGADAQDIDVVVFHGLARDEGVVADRRPDARDLAALIAALVFVILDLDRPRRGLITVSK